VARKVLGHHNSSGQGTRLISVLKWKRQIEGSNVCRAELEVMD